ncbi:MAG: hypothetical protein ACYC9I_02835 [Desulfuromonadales bacterium]
MYEATALRRLRRTLLIHRIVQILLCVLLIYMALHFQQLFAAKGMPHVFRNSLLATLLLQFVLFFPLRSFADKEARRELAAAAMQVTVEQQKQLRHQRLFGDILKGAVFLGFSAFILIAPPVTFVLSTALFCFIVTVVTYLQCFNFVVRRELGNTSPA